MSADVVWEDDELIAFRDIHPRARVHILLAPKIHIPSLAETSSSNQALMGRLLMAVVKLARTLRIEKGGYRTIINTRGHSGQEVDHLHIHLLGGEPLGAMTSPK